MNLLFFGSARRQLFGAYHAPTVAGRGAAVLCPPWGPEYLVAHRALRRLAARLSERGYHVLRFDYYGTGDSAGERVDGDLASWVDDASTAVDELRDMSGFPTVAALGIRLGAVVAWRLAQQRDDVRTVVLWDPVMDGAAYVRELLTAQAENDRWSLAPQRPRADDEPRHALGFPLTSPMRRSMEAVSAEELGRPSHARVHVTESMPGQSPWREDETVGASGPSALALDRLVELLP